MTTDHNLEAYLAPLALLQDKRERLTRGLVQAYTQLALKSEDQFLATPVTKLPTGTEKGEFLAIDLGGSNLRVAFINLLGRCFQSSHSVKRDKDKAHVHLFGLRLTSAVAFHFIGSTTETWCFDFHVLVGFSALLPCVFSLYLIYSFLISLLSLIN